MKLTVNYLKIPTFIILLVSIFLGLVKEVIVYGVEELGPRMVL